MIVLRPFRFGNESLTKENPLRVPNGAWGSSLSATVSFYFALVVLYT